MDKNNKLSVDNNKVVEIINKYYDIQWSLDIILDMVKEPYDKKTETPLEYIKRKVTHYYVDDDVPKNHRLNPKYNNELLDIYDFFEEKIKLLRSKGIKHNNIILDPGIGFGKKLKHNMNLIRSVSIFHSLGFPILVGNSRKRFIKDISKKNDSFTRIGGTISSSLYLMTQGVQILRIHDVNEVMQAIKVFKEITNK